MVWGLRCLVVALVVVCSACEPEAPPLPDAARDGGSDAALDVRPGSDVLVTDSEPDVPVGPLVCMPNTSDCNGSRSDGCEVDLQNNPEHCGACNMRCPGNDRSLVRCVMGRCMSTCFPGYFDCDNNPANGCEVSPLNAEHCGRCGNVCPASAGFCAKRTDGMFVCTTLCPAGTVACGAQCPDTSSDIDHCGACDRRCMPGLRCRAGMCVSPIELPDAGADAASRD